MAPGVVWEALEGLGDRKLTDVEWCHFPHCGHDEVPFWVYEFLCELTECFFVVHSLSIHPLVNSLLVCQTFS